MKLYISHASNYDFQTELYEPLSEAFGSNHQLYLPHDPQNNGKNSKDEIVSSDLIIAEVSGPSTGQGIELGWANDAGVPIICFYKSGTEPSGALRFVAKSISSYEDTKDMISRVGKAIS